MKGTSMSCKSLKDPLKDWVLQVKESLNATPPLGAGGIYPFPRVPKSLRNEKTEAFYTPQVISFGPYHFQMKESIFDDEVEVLKSEVAGKVHCLLTNNLFQVVEKLMGEETQEQIKKIYAKGFPSLSRDVLAWMMTRDACLLVAILNTCSKKKRKEKIPLLSMYHPLLNDIVKDMFKMENQLPLWVLDEVKTPLGWCEDGFFESALKNLSPVEVSRKNSSPVEVSRNDTYQSKYNPEYHILHLLREYIVGPSPDVTSSALAGHPSRVPPSKFQIQILVYNGKPIWIYICNRRVRLGLIVIFISVIILPILFPLLVIRLIWFIMQERYQSSTSGKVELETNHVPTLEELKTIGVRFRKLEGRGISHIQFEESSRTLYLPKFKVDDRSEVILRNLMATEICLEEKEKPITRYAILMNDLVNTSADIAILRRYDIVTSKLGSDDDVAELWNSIVVATEMPTYEPIDSAAEKINAYRQKRWKIFWAQFMMIHCSKPWVVLSLLGGISLLLLTIVQVVCLFASCQIK